MRGLAVPEVLHVERDQGVRVEADLREVPEVQGGYRREHEPKAQVVSSPQLHVLCDEVVKAESEVLVRDGGVL